MQYFKEPPDAGLADFNCNPMLIELLVIINLMEFDRAGN